MEAKKVKTITIKIGPVSLDSNIITEKMVIKENKVSYLSYNSLSKETINKWRYKSNHQNMSVIFDFLNAEIDRIMDLGLMKYKMDKEKVIITQVYEDNKRRLKIFTGSFEINDLDILAVHLLDLIPQFESIPQFLSEFKNSDDELDILLGGMVYE